MNPTPARVDRRGKTSRSRARVLSQRWRVRGALEEQEVRSVAIWNSRGLASSLGQFMLVGCAGFLVDGSFLTLLVSIAGWTPWEARSVSFPAAVTATWWLNRNFAFKGRGNFGGPVEYAAYVGIQVAGAAINLAVFGLLLQMRPSLAATPLVPLAAGAAVALSFNFTLARVALYRRLRAVDVQSTTAQLAEIGYTGRDNLEVMRHAERYNAWLVDLVLRHAPADAHALDFGAGSGTFAAKLHRMGLRLICMEPDTVLRTQLRESGLEAVGSLEDVQDASFDYIYSLNVLEHIDDDLFALRQLRSKLRPGGLLLVYVPALPVLYSAMDRKVGHRRRYRRTPLIRLVNEAGFEVRVARYADSLGFLAALVYRIAGDESGNIDTRQLEFYDRNVFPVSLVLDKICARICGKNLLVIAQR
jgi:putative flippase GtrA/predicted SAM-dependent methyltransferase